MEAKKVLMVDDEPDIIQALSLRLRFLGYRVITVGDAYHGVHDAVREAPDLIILDISESTIVGLEAVKRIRNSLKTARIPIIFMTTSVVPEDMRKAIEAGVTHYITKPYRMEDLLSIIESTFIREEKDVGIHQ